jgi:hypothetical protein
MILRSIDAELMSDHLLRIRELAHNDVFAPRDLRCLSAMATRKINRCGCRPKCRAIKRVRIHCHIVHVNAGLRHRDVLKRNHHRLGVEWILERTTTSLLRTFFGVHRGKKPTTNSGLSSRSFAPARAKGTARWVSGGTPNSLCSSTPEKAQALQQPLPLPPQSRQRRLAGVMSTPELTFSDLHPSKNGDDSKRECSTSTYCGECICGRHFEIRWREWVCPACQRQIEIEWAA